MLSIIMPRICICCGLIGNDPKQDLCTYCTTYLPWLKDRCYVCGENLTNDGSCNRCLNGLPPYDRMCALFNYTQPLIRIIYSLKFGRKLDYANLLGTLLAEQIINNWYKNKILPEVIIPVPLYSARHRARGYNQALEIARTVAKHVGIPVDSSSCIRTKNTVAQALQTKEARYKNMQSAFSVNTTYKYVAILDDVVTTGSTVKAVSLALKKSGVENIDIWCVCRG